MNLYFNKNFKKKYKKLRVGEKQKCDERLMLFAQYPFHPLLNNHMLKGEYKEYRSINVSGDLRALYELVSKDVAHFIDIDTHNKLYSK
jgi:addiction module RelE/StbE family toxin